MHTEKKKVGEGTGKKGNKQQEKFCLVDYGLSDSPCFSS